MLKSRNHSDRWIWVYLVLLSLGIGLALVACRPTKPIVLTQHDSTHTERIVTYRDTVIHVPGDQAELRVGADMAALSALVSELRGQVLTIRGERQAALQLVAASDTLRIVALCDELQMRLDSALVRDSIMHERVRTYEHFIQDNVQTKAPPMPGWAKGVALVTGCLVVLYLLFTFIKTLR